MSAFLKLPGKNARVRLAPDTSIITTFCVYGESPGRKPSDRQTLPAFMASPFVV